VLEYDIITFAQWCRRNMNQNPQKHLHTKDNKFGFCFTPHPYPFLKPPNFELPALFNIIIIIISSNSSLTTKMKLPIISTLFVQAALGAALPPTPADLQASALLLQSSASPGDLPSTLSARDMERRIYITQKIKGRVLL
jgi:hypothetical protein